MAKEPAAAIKRSGTRYKSKKNARPLNNQQRITSKSSTSASGGTTPGTDVGPGDHGGDPAQQERRRRARRRGHEHARVPRAQRRGHDERNGEHQEKDRRPQARQAR